MTTILTSGTIPLVSVQSVVVNITAAQVVNAILVRTVNVHIALPMTNSIRYNEQASDYVNHYPKRFKE